MSTIIKSLIKVFILFAALAAILEFLEPTLTLDGARNTLSKKLQSYTGREIHIDGDIQLTLSYSPHLLVKRIHIKNSADFDDEDFITISEVSIEIRLLPLLQGQIHLSDISADQAKIDFHQKADGDNNWSPAETTETVEVTTREPSDSKDGSFDIERIILGKIELTNIDILYRDDTRQQSLKNRFDQLLIDISDETKPVAEINGSIEDHPYAIVIQSESLDRLLAGEPLTLRGTGHVANRQTSIHADIQFKEGEFISNLDFDVKDVDLGLLLNELKIIPDLTAVTENINIKSRLKGKDLAELYERAEISLELGKGYWHLQQKKTGKDKELMFNRASSFVSWKQAVELSIDGRIDDTSITIDLKSNRLEEFFDDIEKLDIDLVARVAKTEMTLKGDLALPINSRLFSLDITIRGENMEKLNPIINTEFPPINNYTLSGKLIANDTGYILKSAAASIGESKLQASVVIDTNAIKPLWYINLNSQQIQLEDFAFSGLDLTENASTDDSIAVSQKKTSRERPLLEYLRQLEEALKTPAMHLDLNLNVGKVLSGRDQLGKAQLKLHLRDDIFIIENAKLEIPGGIISSSISLKRGNDEASGHVSLDIDKLDYGITTRLFQPDSTIDGKISTRIALDLGGKDFTRLLERASGQVDFAVWPKNTKPTKALNLWTTNLYLILLPELKKKESLVNCLVGLLDIDDGMMKEELFAIDTTKLWIYGNLDVDFKQEQIELSLFPVSKTARLFSLETPLRAQGSFSSINLLLNPIDLTGTYINFITSPLHVPVRRIFADKVLEDGSTICERLFDRDHVTRLKAKAETKSQQEIEELLESY
ncbi:MAG: AsmA family protein [Gammaproteobacteria bacterium]|nr:AsmA family protein [Gammaproteobacteria bacterium]MBT8134446.1 AsmA family protein [Gammaproteobacteria bacterium]NNJ50140.1 AsmA family protein [Gammaproteobacteria bacterium]